MVKITKHKDGAVTVETDGQTIKTKEDGYFDASDIVSILIEYGIEVTFKKANA